MCKHSHLTLQDRITIQIGISNAASKADIASFLEQQNRTHNKHIYA